MDNDKLEILNNCENGCDDGTPNSSNMRDSMRRTSPGFRVDSTNTDGELYGFDLLRESVSNNFDLGLKYTYLKNIFNNKETFYRDVVKKRPIKNKDSNISLNNIPRESNNLGDKYSEEDLKDLNRTFVARSNNGLNIVPMRYDKVDEETLSITSNFYRIQPNKRLISDSDLCSQIDCNFTFFVDDEVTPPETIFPPGNFFRIAYDTQEQSLSKTPCEQQIYFVKEGNCVCPIPNKETLQVMLVERNKVIQSVFVIEPSQFEPFEVIDPCIDRTSEWIPRYEVDSGCKAPELNVDLSALDRIKIPELPDVIQGPPGTPGAPGPAGAAGAPGPAGAAGPAGAVGSPGAAGPAGAAGPQGPQGPQGPKGDAGADGADGADGGGGGGGDQGGEDTSGGGGNGGGECRKYEVITRGGKLLPAKIFYIDCDGNPIIDTLRARGNYRVEVCAIGKPVYVDNNSIPYIKTQLTKIALRTGATINPLLAILTNSILNSRAPIVEDIGPCSPQEDLDIPIDGDLDSNLSNNFSVTITHNIPNRFFDVSLLSGEFISVGFDSPYIDKGTPNVLVPEFDYSLGDVVTMKNDNGDDEQYVLTDVRESSPTGDVRLSNIGQRTSDFQSVGRTVASNIKYVFIFTKVEGDLTDEEPIDPDLNSGDNGNTSNVRTGGVRTNTGNQDRTLTDITGGGGNGLRIR